jgi:hypothetical protein
LGYHHEWKKYTHSPIQRLGCLQIKHNGLFFSHSKITKNPKNSKLTVYQSIAELRLQYDTLATAIEEK